MHGTLKRMHAKPRRNGTTLDHFRLNEVVSQIAFGGRRGRVYRRIVSLAQVQPGNAVLDVGCSSGYLSRKLAAAVGPAGHVTGADPSGGDRLCATAGGRQYDVRRERRPGPAAAGLVVHGHCTLAMHHIPARQREAALREMYRVTRPGGRLLVADFDHHDDRSPCTQAAAGCAARPPRSARWSNSRPPPDTRSNHPAHCPCSATSRPISPRNACRPAARRSLIMGGWCLAAAGWRGCSSRPPRLCWRASLPRAARKARGPTTGTPATQGASATQGTKANSARARERTVDRAL